MEKIIKLLHASGIGELTQSSTGDCIGIRGQYITLEAYLDTGSIRHYMHDVHIEERRFISPATVIDVDPHVMVQELEAMMDLQSKLKQLLADLNSESA